MLSKDPSASMIIAVSGYYGNEVINVKDGHRQKYSTAYVGGQTENVFPEKERYFPGMK